MGETAVVVQDMTVIQQMLEHKSRLTALMTHVVSIKGTDFGPAAESILARDVTVAELKGCAAASSASTPLSAKSNRETATR